MKVDVSISSINSKIRDFVNDSAIKKTSLHSKKKQGYWDLFFSALDTIGDTCAAVESFRGLLDKTFLENKYLITYGLVQTLFIQQDAVKHLKQAVLGINLDYRTEYPDLYQMRLIRHQTVGHPVQTTYIRNNPDFSKDEISATTINRSTLSKKGFEYILWMHSKTEHKHINFQEIIELQEKSLAHELSKIYKQLTTDEKTHKKKFKDEKLADLLNEKTLYQLNLIYGVIWNDHLAWPSFDYFSKQYNLIRQGLEKRYGKFGASMRIPGTAEVIKKLDYIFAKLETFKKVQQIDLREFEIYVDALCAEITELKDHLAEVDAEFNDEK